MMRVVENHPAWPQHADFACPKCGQLHAEDPYEDQANESREATGECVKCGTKLKFKRIVRVTYETMECSPPLKKTSPE